MQFCHTTKRNDVCSTTNVPKRAFIDELNSPPRRWEQFPYRPSGLQSQTARLESARPVESFKMLL
jgi:hypothetical protein